MDHKIPRCYQDPPKKIIKKYALVTPIFYPTFQCLGFDVDPINSVQFSNHTGYKNGFKGQILNANELEELYQGLAINDLQYQYTHLLTGYCGNDTFLRQIKEIIKRLREANPNITYCK